MKYVAYDVMDFVLDEHFKQWVLSPETSNSKFWESWLRENPEKASVVSEARQMILLIHFKKDHPENQDFQQVWQHITQAIDEEPESETAKVVPFTVLHSSVKKKHVYPVAASLAAILLLGLGCLYAYFSFFGQVTLSTDYGEIKTVVLPDNSVVKLNAHSQISYARHWDDAAVREVWLQGEAFFSVTHQTNHTPFIVRTEHLAVRVLGTEFNVDQRKDKTEVVLNSGKVKVDLQEQSIAESMIEMQPGELLAYTHADNKIAHKKVDAEKATAWRNNQLIYEEIPIKEVITDMEQQFGFDIQVRQNDILQYRFTGVVPADNADAFFATIKNTFGVQVKREGQKIMIDKH